MVFAVQNGAKTYKCNRLPEASGQGLDERDYAVLVFNRSIGDARDVRVDLTHACAHFPYSIRQIRAQLLQIPPSSISAPRNPPITPVRYLRLDKPDAQAAGLCVSNIPVSCLAGIATLTAPFIAVCSAAILVSLGFPLEKNTFAGLSAGMDAAVDAALLTISAVSSSIAASGTGRDPPP